MSDPRYKLQASFDPNKRHANYGDVLTQLHIKGFRNHTDTVLEIESPVTALCGVNGSGKSTVLQLAAAAYQSLSGQRYYVSTFILAGTLDSKPFESDASVDITYAQPPGSHGKIQKRTLSISRSGSSWSGYERQPRRSVTFLGFGFYLPHAERDSQFKSLISDDQFVSRYKRPLDDSVIARVSQILLCKYDEAHQHQMRKKYARRHTPMTTARRRDGLEYSEANMGSGEARLYALVNRIETAYEKSLVLIEEPETALHPCAQFELGKYLVDVSLRRNLQVIITTHSEYLMLALPQKSRIYLKREEVGVTPINGVGVRQAVSMMDGYAIPSVYVIVEDDVAEAIVVELLRKHDPDFLKTTRILIGGDKDQISRMMSVLDDQRIPVCAVRDADFGDDPKRRMYKLFGNAPPEKEIFKSASVREHLVKERGVDWDAVDIENQNKDHHQWFDALIKQTAMKKAELLPVTARAYLEGVHEIEQKALLEQIKASIP
ncbi:AAA family ATPase [uncultured Rubinisphaera sp.]|uniref:ATP-dependent nuclease n=1 Tax=uncultured Rubinisphaera sp. TaxID=1678686 RepID=UPI0030DA42C7